MRQAALTAIAVLLAFPAGVAADPAEGRKLMEEKKCEACHSSKVRGDAKAIYLRKDRKVTTLEKLKAQVAVCNSELGLQLFPEDEAHIVDYLNQAYYKFPVRK